MHISIPSPGVARGGARRPSSNAPPTIEPDPFSVPVGPPPPAGIQEIARSPSCPENARGSANATRRVVPTNEGRRTTSAGAFGTHRANPG